MTGIDFYGDLTGTGILRDEPVTDETRGPDSVECQPSSHYRHTDCLLDYRSFTGRPSMDERFGFICGCVCHDDPEPK